MINFRESKISCVSAQIHSLLHYDAEKKRIMFIQQSTNNGHYV